MLFDFSRNGASKKICLRRAASRILLRWKPFAAQEMFSANLYACQKRLRKIYALWNGLFSGSASVLMSRNENYDGIRLHCRNFVNNLSQVSDFYPQNFCIQLWAVFGICSSEFQWDATKNTAQISCILMVHS